MADAIERLIEANGEVVDCFAYVGKPGWHKKGQKLGDAPDPSLDVRTIEAAARANWLVYKDDIKASKTGKLLKGHQALIRDRDDKVMGLCSAQYKVHQHVVALGDILQVLVDMKRGTWETVGVLNDGQRIFYTVRMNTISPVKNDPIEMYAIATTRHDGSGATDWLVSGTRVVCQNTLNAAMEANVRAIHVGDTAAKLAQAREALLGVGADVQKMNTGMQQLTSIVLQEQQVQRFLDKVQPVKQLPPPDVFDRWNSEKQSRFQYDIDLGLRVQDKIKELHEAAPGQQQAGRGTAYAWLNAVTNYATHHMRSDSKIESVMVGDASKMGRRAFQILTDKRQLEEVVLG